MKFVFEPFPTLRLINFPHIYPHHLPAAPVWALPSGNVLQEHNNNIKPLFRSVTNPAWQGAARAVVSHIKTNLLIFNEYQCFESLWTFRLKYLFISSRTQPHLSLFNLSFLPVNARSTHAHVTHSFNSSRRFHVLISFGSRFLLPTPPVSIYHLQFPSHFGELYVYDIYYISAFTAEVQQELVFSHRHNIMT